MAISDYKITAEDIAKYGCVSLPDTLTGDAQENKAKFDRLVRECVANAVNAVIDHMVLVENEAQDWASAEALRVQAEAARVAAENLRVQAENDRADAETARAAAETARVLAENLRAEAETARANAENKRDTAEKSRVSAETGRVNAESARVTAESQRANAESVRAQNEAARISAETGRADAEADRVSAEDTRIANENARKSAETDRASAETMRESGENARKSAEKARASAEQQRESTESTRQTNETARVSAEKSRVAAETARQAAENARNVWEEYSAGKAYAPGNKVSFNGSSYVCTDATTGHAPTDTAYWLLIAQKGTDGKGAGDMLASVYDPKGKAQDVFAYTDQKIAAIPTPDVSGQIETHNTAKNAHSALFAKKQDKITGKKGQFVGFTADNVPGAVDAPSGGVNPNLLDNWYFGNPVNQRNGYYIPAGVKYNTLSWTEAGTTDKAYPVIGYSGQDPLIIVNGTNYIVGKSEQVPGYCVTGYTIDRWKFTTDGGNVAISNGYLDIYSPKQYGSYLEQKIDPELAKALAGKTVTVSVFAADDDTAFSVNMYKNGSYVDSFTIKPNTVSYKTWTFPTDSTDILFNFAGNAAGHVRPIAIKLELGDTQTLAHKENGVWVLNEIPDFREQWLRCRRYCKVFPKGSDLPVLAFAQPEKRYLSAFISFDDMRTVPANNLGSGIKCHIFSIDSDDVSASETIMNWGSTPTGQKLRISDNAVSSADFPFRINMDADLIFSADL